MAEYIDAATVRLDFLVSAYYPGPNTGQQWVKIKEKPSGLNAFLERDLDPDFTDTIQEAWHYIEVYVPATLITSLGINTTSSRILDGDGFGLYIRVDGSGNPHWRRTNQAGTQIGSDIPLAGTDKWYRIEWHNKISTADCDLRIDRNMHLGTDPAPPAGLNYMLASFPDFTPGGGYIGIDNMTYSLAGWVSDDAAHAGVESFEGGTDILNFLNEQYPEQGAWFIMFGPIGSDTVTVESGSPGPGPGLDTFEYTVPLLLTVSGVEDYSGLTEFTDSATAFLLLSPSGTFQYDDVNEIYLDLSVHGGECFSTSSGANLGFGEASLRWIGRASLRWAGEADLRWSPGDASVGEQIHC